MFYTELKAIANPFGWVRGTPLGLTVRCKITLEKSRCSHELDLHSQKKNLLVVAILVKTPCNEYVITQLTG